MGSSQLVLCHISAVELHFIGQRPQLLYLESAGVVLQVGESHRINTGTTLDFTFYICSRCSFRPGFSSIFFCRFDLIVSWDYHTYHYCCFLLILNHHHIWLGGEQLLVCLELKVPQDLTAVVFNCFLWCLPSGPGRFKPIYGTDVSVPLLLVKHVRAWSSSSHCAG